MMKKLINQPGEVVNQALAGMARAHGDLLRVNFDPKFIARADAPVAGKVALVSGGGSGHEPLHGGYVGRGMLDAACPGEIFTSPTPDQMEAAALAVSAGAGVLFIVKNYTGDVLNFEMAAELLQAQDIPVETVLIDDDVAVTDSLYTAGRRGVGATVLCEKICGAAAEQGWDLARVAELGRRVNAQARSMGVALTGCTTPGAGKATFTLGPDEMEVGIGIHGEPGRERRPLAPAAEVAAMLTQAVTVDLPFQRGDQTIVLLGGMGGTPLLELYLMLDEVARLLDGMGIAVARVLVGNYITSLEMAGCALTLLKADDEMLDLWDQPVLTTGLRWGA